MGTLMRLTSMSVKPERNENHRLVDVLFSRNDLVDSNFLAVEKSTYFPSGSSPVHAEGHSEEIIYFRRGRGKVLLGKDYAGVGPGSAVAIPDRRAATPRQAVTSAGRRAATSRCRASTPARAAASPARRRSAAGGAVGVLVAVEAK